MHTFGHPCDVESIVDVAEEFNITVVEDAAESLGSFSAGKHTGTHGLLGTLSFNGNKIITTGGGGAILTNDAQLARKAKHLATTAKTHHKWEYSHDEIGFNYRMPNLNAALGCAQLEQLESFRSSKRTLFERYQSAFENFENMKIVQEPVNTSSNYWLQSLLLSEDLVGQRDELLSALNDAGLQSRPIWNLLPRQIPFRNSPCASIPVATQIERRVINLPSSAGLA